jgi:hypothetical protein
MSTKELKQRIRKLKKIKKELHAGSAPRIKVHREIKKLKEELQEKNLVSKEKQLLIEEINKLDTLVVQLGTDLTQYTEEQLAIHLNKLRKEK